MECAIWAAARPEASVEKRISRFLFSERSIGSSKVDLKTRNWVSTRKQTSKRPLKRMYETVQKDKSRRKSTQQGLTRTPFSHAYVVDPKSCASNQSPAESSFVMGRTRWGITDPQLSATKLSKPPPENLLSALRFPAGQRFLHAGKLCWSPLQSTSVFLE